MLSVFRIASHLNFVIFFTLFFASILLLLLLSTVLAHFLYFVFSHPQISPTSTETWVGREGVVLITASVCVGLSCFLALLPQSVVLLLRFLVDILPLTVSLTRKQAVRKRETITSVTQKETNKENNTQK